MSGLKQAQVIYYLCRGGSLEHPHLIDVGYTQESGLLLKDVKRRLVAIRGRGMPDLFSWSYKTQYRNDFIWHDVSDNDVVLPMTDAEYILKGSEIVGGELENDSDGEIQCKKVLKEHACLAKSPIHRGIPVEECVIQTTNHLHHPTADTGTGSVNEVKVYKQKSSLEHGNDATTQTDDTGVFTKHDCCQCRGEKPLASPQSLPPTKETSSCIDKAPQGTEAGAIAKEDNGRTKRTGGGTSLLFRQMLPCADIGTRSQPNGLSGQKQDLLVAAAVAAPKENLILGSWTQQHSKGWKKSGGRLSPLLDSRAKIGRLSPLLDSGTRKIITDGRHSYDSKHLPGTPSSKYQELQNQRYSTLTRYRPRHSFSNSDYFDSDLFLRPEKVKEMDGDSMAWSRPSNASRVSLESLYEVDCKQQPKGSPAAGKCDDSPRASVGNHIISKLVLEAKANEEKDKVWWEEIRATPRRESKANEERMRKNKLDWEKNLQDAVTMIIRPPQEQR